MTFNPKSLENLTPFKEGNPGGGRKKGSVSFASVIKKVLKQQMVNIDPITQKESNKKLREWIVITLVSKAINGDIQAIKELLERVDGKIVQKNEVKMNTQEQSLKDLE